MEFMAVGIEDVSGLLGRLGLGIFRGAAILPHWLRHGFRRGLLLLRLLTGKPALPCGVVDLHSGLDIVHIHIEADPGALVLHTVGLHLHAVGYQVEILENRRHPIEYMVAGLLHIVRHLIFKGQHPLHIHVAGAGDEIFLVGVFSGKLVADEMAAVIEVLAVHDVILHRLPAGGLHLADLTTLLRGHQILSHIGVSGAAPAQKIQGAVRFKGLCGHICLGKIRLVVVNDHIGIPGKSRQILHGKGDLRSSQPGKTGTSGEQDTAAKEQGTKGSVQDLHEIPPFLSITKSNPPTAPPPHPASAGRPADPSCPCACPARSVPSGL